MKNTSKERNPVRTYLPSIGDRSKSKDSIKNSLYDANNSVHRASVDSSYVTNSNIQNNWRYRSFEQSLRNSVLDLKKLNDSNPINFSRQSKHNAMLKKQIEQVHSKQLEALENLYKKTPKQIPIAEKRVNIRLEKVDLIKSNQPFNVIAAKQSILENKQIKYKSKGSIVNIIIADDVVENYEDKLKNISNNQESLTDYKKFNNNLEQDATGNMYGNTFV